MFAWPGGWKEEISCLSSKVGKVAQVGGLSSTARPLRSLRRPPFIMRYASPRRWLRAVVLPAVLWAGLAHAKDSVERCRAQYPELLARADQELKPWEHTGITRKMLDDLWRCDGGDPTKVNALGNLSLRLKEQQIEHPPPGSLISPIPTSRLKAQNKALYEARKFVGLRGLIHQGSMYVEKSVGRLVHMAYVRPETLEKLLRSVHAQFDLPDVEFVMMTADHAEQAYNPTDGMPRKHRYLATQCLLTLFVAPADPPYPHYPANTTVPPLSTLFVVCRCRVSVGCP